MVDAVAAVSRPVMLLLQLIVGHRLGLVLGLRLRDGATCAAPCCGYALSPYSDFLPSPAICNPPRFVYLPAAPAAAVVMRASSLDGRKADTLAVPARQPVGARQLPVGGETTKEPGERRH